MPTELEMLIITLQNRIDEARNKGTKVTTVFISTLSKCLKMAKEQKPVEAELEGGGSTWWYVCGECHGEIGRGDAYCKHCGRRQIWDK